MEKKIVFISHITEEKELAKILSDEIKKSYLGMLDTFVSSDGESLPSGGRWLDKIDQALNQSAIQISLCSPQSLKRPWINFEAGASWIRKIPVIPLCHSGLKKNELPIPLSLLQGANIDNETDLQGMFQELTKTLGASMTPNIDYKSIILKASDFEKEYTVNSKIRNAIFEIITYKPELSDLFLSGKIMNQEITISDFAYNDLAHKLEMLRAHNLINYNFTKTMFTGNGTFKGGMIALNNDYFNKALPLLK